VLLAVIGPGWATESERRRLDDPNDFVRLEIISALERKIRVIPVLVGDAKMPRADELPAPLAPFARHQAHEVSDKRWKFDIEALSKIIEKAGVKRRNGGRVVTDRISRKAIWASALLVFALAGYASGVKDNQGLGALVALLLGALVLGIVASYDIAAHRATGRWLAIGTIALAGIVTLALIPQFSHVPPFHESPPQPASPAPAPISAPVQSGLTTGAGSLTCGCHGYVEFGTVRPNGRCASGYEVVMACGWACDAGGMAWGALCQ